MGHRVGVFQKLNPLLQIASVAGPFVDLLKNRGGLRVPAEAHSLLALRECVGKPVLLLKTSAIWS